MAPQIEVKDKLPRGHAYIRIRNAEFSVHMDFRDKDCPFVEEMLQLILKRHGEWVKEQQGNAK